MPNEIDVDKPDDGAGVNPLPSLQKTRTAVLEAARGYIGTPWAHTGRVKGAGVDCTGLLVCTSRDLGLNIIDFVNYTDSDEFTVLIQHLNKYVYAVDKSEMKPGDILVFRGRMMYNHVGYLTEKNTLLHAYRTSGLNKVVETPIDANWLARLNSVYRYAGIIEGY